MSTDKKPEKVRDLPDKKIDSDKADQVKGGGLQKPSYTNPGNS